MSSPAVLDVDALCAPLSEGAPTGAYLRSDAKLEPLWWEFSDLLQKEREKEKQLLSGGEEGAKSEPARWEKVVEVGTKILTTASKDLWVVAGVIEALVRSAGFAGLRDGFQLAGKLTATFREALHPPKDEADADDSGLLTMYLRLDGLDNSLPDVIRRLPIVASASHPPYSTFDHIRASQGRGGTSLADIQAAAGATPAANMQRLAADVAEALKAVADFCSSADEVSGRLAPSLSQIRKTLEDAQQRTRSLAGDSPMEGASAGAGEGGESAGVGGAGAASAGGGGGEGPLKTREDAFRLLDRLATFFERTEPHSPLSTVLRDLVGWRTLSFVELMEKLIDDSGARRDLFRRTGAPKRESD